eukprot:CCRYP_000485-RA/>CCRYP_000485-RA protein AED:0.01 eAED:0.01 QI:481/1/1/1/1/1/2/348/277
MVASASACEYPKKPNRSSSALDAGGESAVSGRWTAAEHEAFLAGLKVYGREWKKVSTCIPTRTPAQIRSHAQKYFNKVSKEHHEFMAIEATRHFSCPAQLMSKTESPVQMTSVDKLETSSSYLDIVSAISRNPESAESRVSRTLNALQERYSQLENTLRRIKSEEQPKACSTEECNAPSLGPASAALKAEQQILRKAAKARYELKQSQQSSPKNTNSNRMANSCCANVSLASMTSSARFDSRDVLALSMLGGSFGRDNVEHNSQDEQPPSKLRKTEH